MTGGVGIVIASQSRKIIDFLTISLVLQEQFSDYTFPNQALHFIKRCFGLKGCEEWEEWEPDKHKRSATRCEPYSVPLGICSIQKNPKRVPEALPWHCAVGANNSSQEILCDHEQLFAWIRSQTQWIPCQKAANVGQYCHISNSNIAISVLFISAAQTRLDQYAPCH